MTKEFQILKETVKRLVEQAGQLQESNDGLRSRVTQLETQRLQASDPNYALSGTLKASEASEPGEHGNFYIQKDNRP
jgi:phage shock protein A